MSKVKDVFIFTNGNVMIFNENGEQMSDYQGFILEIAPKLIEICDKDTNFEFVKMGRDEEWKEPVDFSWWFEEHKDDTNEVSPD